MAKTKYEYINKQTKYYFSLRENIVKENDIQLVYDCMSLASGAFEEYRRHLQNGDYSLRLYTFDDVYKHAPELYKDSVIGSLPGYRLQCLTDEYLLRLNIRKTLNLGKWGPFDNDYELNVTMYNKALDEINKEYLNTND